MIEEETATFPVNGFGHTSTNLKRKMVTLNEQRANDADLEKQNAIAEIELFALPEVNKDLTEYQYNQIYNLGVIHNVIHTVFGN